MPVAPTYRQTMPTGLSTQRLAVLFVILVTLALLALVGWQSWTSRAQALREAGMDAANLAHSLAQHADDTFEEADASLSSVIERVETDGMGPGQISRLHAVLQSQQRFIGQLAGLFVYDEQGRWVVTSNETDPLNANNADREYFRYHMNNPDRGPHVGAAIQSRSTHEWVIPLSRRINHPDGSFAGVALATLRLSYFNEFYNGFDLDAKGVIVLALRDGTILTRRPFDANAVGASIAKARLFTDLLPVSPVGNEMARSMVDGIERMYAYRQAEEYPIVSMAATSKEAIFAEWEANLARSAGFVAIVLAAMALCALVLLRQIRHGLKTEAELRNAHAALHKLAMQDSLTGLANRRQLDAALPDEIGRARRGGKSLGLIMLDIDHFKRFNDLYGHPAGDECIKAVGQAVLGCCGRSGDLVVRYGGEELLVLLPECDEDGAQRMAEKILNAVRQLQLHHAGNDTGYVTISAGVHVMRTDDPALRAQSLIQAADQALYQAKSLGRNRLCLSRPNSPEHVRLA
ncbi:sensor domain-containing diguanylate cyclase [Pseudomonas sp. dw_358]|uniref:sensor domain-containing diguanylate cyclase n=1 Tax=Pseudomonas sp. dw_358 TaxID=2720083 RepID=UPI001BD320B6|nr:sensor domain-containing diguanylate cyclase [Pseudomonas sp. dw_358]